jgi:hypothetical protein
MPGRRGSLALALASILLLGSFACAEVDTQDDAAATDEPAATQQDQGCIAGDGEGPAIQWQNTTVDIEPASRFGNDSDIAYVTTTVAASEDEADDVQRELEQVEDATVEASEDGRMFTVTQRIDVEQADDDEYRFQMNAPLEGTRLAKDGDISVVVQLPRSSEGADEDASFEVELVSATSDEDVPEATIHDGKENPLIGERITVAWFWCVDPPIDVIYKMVF